MLANVRTGTLIASIVVASIVAPRRVSAQFETVPGPSHYAAVDQLYEGEYRDAYQTFRREVLIGGRKIGVQTKWVDSICYHAMLGETFYQWGRLAEALEQFDLACTLYLQYPNWLMRVQFGQAAPAANVRGRGARWGAPTRQSLLGKYRNSYLVRWGQVNNNEPIQRGGVMNQAQLWSADVVEILRCLALSMRRRNAILGLLGPHNDLSKDLAGQLANGGAPVNHWSGAFVDVLHGIARAGVGENARASQALNRGLLVMGQLDHPLTGVALLELGRLEALDGNLPAAGRYCVEAGISAYEFDDPNVIDDSFQWSEAIRLAVGDQGVNPALSVAAAWAGQKRLDQIFVRTNLAGAAEFMQQGDWNSATKALAAAQSKLNDARTGLLGVRAQYLQAKLEFHLGRDSADANLAAAVEAQKRVSLWNFQIGLADAMFDQRALPARNAATIYEQLLRDPLPTDVALDLLDVFAVIKTSHEGAYTRWMTAMWERKDYKTAMIIADRAKRRRYHLALPWGGRLSALRHVATAPEQELTPDVRQAQAALRAQFPALADAIAAETQARAALREDWHPDADVDKQREQGRAWQQYAEAIDQREAWLQQIALKRVPADMTFPPPPIAEKLARRLGPGQAVLSYHDTPGGLLAFLCTSEACVAWDCGSTDRLHRRLITPLLQALGNFDANREMTVNELLSDEWRKPAAALYEALLGTSQLDLSALEELIVVPDGPLWYVPIEALAANVEGQLTPLISLTRVRYAPTVALAVSNAGPFRRVQRTGVLVGDLVPGERPEHRDEEAAALEAAVQDVVRLESPLPAAAPVTACVLDQLVVLEDVETAVGGPLDWSPLPLDRRDAPGTLAAWTAIPHYGPQRIFLPGMHTAAEHGGRGTRRRGAAATPGDELFFASCALMSAGAETIMFSRWRVGGQSMLEMVRELVIELPHSGAAEAWQRSVQIASSTPIDPLDEMRVEGEDENGELTAAHPFFWAGYLVVDSGWTPPSEAEVDPNDAAPASVEGAVEPVAQPAVDPPAGAVDQDVEQPPDAAAEPAGALSLPGLEVDP